MKKVLVVEDNKTIADLVTERLKADGFRARSVSENSAIWKNIDDWNPDIILLDIMMPGEDGISILLRLKSNEEADVQK
jgi:DNA-binding response OmpR family regulator